MARGYIASGEFSGYRAPQHIQNQIIKNYCDANDLIYVLSRAEYWINGSTQCQLWAALNEGYNHVVLFSLWQLPNDEIEREKIYEHCKERNITMHFATERINTDPKITSTIDIEILFKTSLLTQGELNGNQSVLGMLENLI